MLHRKSVIYPILVIALLICYSPVILTPYAMLDDYVILAESLRGESGFLIAQTESGRPLEGLSNKVLYSFPTRVSQLRYLRLVGVLGIGLLACLLFRELQHHWWGTSAVFLVLIVSTLPPFQVEASWAFHCAHPYAVALSGLAFCFVRRSFDLDSDSRRWIRYGLAVGLILAALLIYQPAGMFFWVFVAIDLFSTEKSPQEILKRLFTYGCICAIALMAGYGVYRLGIKLFGSDYLTPDRSKLVTNPWAKLQWFVHEPLVNALNLYRIRATPRFALTVLVVIVAGLMFFFQGSWRVRIAKMAMALSLLPISYLPNLVTAENWASYRSQISLTSLVALYAGFAL